MEACMWNANGDFDCKESFFSSRMTYSINIIIKTMDKSAILYSSSLPNIEAASAYILETINSSNFVIQNTPVILEIQDLTNYTSRPPFLQLIIVNSKNQRYDMQFSTYDAMNVLTRTAAMILPSFGPTQIILDRLKMKL
jgi:hypothetical protein